MKATTKSLGIGATAVEALAKGRSYEQTLKLVRELFPDARTNMRNIQWYASKRRTSDAPKRHSSKR